jgi:hypothetical protein
MLVTSGFRQESGRRKERRQSRIRIAEANRSLLPASHGCTRDQISPLEKGTGDSGLPDPEIPSDPIIFSDCIQRGILKVERIC